MEKNKTTRPAGFVIPDPLWERMPLPGHKLEGLSRHSLYRAIHAGSVRWRRVKLRPNAKRSISYVSRFDILQLIENAEDGSTDRGTGVSS